MRKLTVLLSCLFFSCCLFACSSSANDEPEVLGDEQFISAVTQGLEKHWDLTNEIAADASSKEQKDTYKAALQAEIDEIGNLSDYTFESADLKNWANEYLDALNLQLSGVDYAVDYITAMTTEAELFVNYQETYQRGSSQRYVLINDAIDNFGLTVDEEYQVNLEEIISQKNTCQTFLDVSDYISDCTDGKNGFVYEYDEEQSDEYTKIYSAVLENNSGHDLSYLSIQASFIDDDGVSVYEGYDMVNNFQKGKKVKSSIYVDSNLDFSTVELYLSADY
jgi:hypothetical protein